MHANLIGELGQFSVAWERATKMFHQIFFALFLIHQIDGKNYYLLENEADTDNAKYVYSLFGLGDLGKIVSKCMLKTCL